MASFLPVLAEQALEPGAEAGDGRQAGELGHVRKLTLERTDRGQSQDGQRTGHTSVQKNRRGKIIKREKHSECCVLSYYNGQWQWNGLPL